MITELNTHESRAAAEVEAINQVARQGESIKIGILTPLTGPGDPMAGELFIRGACLGAEYIREHGGVRNGKQLEFVVQNDQATAASEGMPRSSVAGLARLAMVDNVFCVIGQWHLRTAEIVSKTAELLGVPIFIENGHNTITMQQRRTLFRTYFTIADRVPLMLRFMVEQKMRRVAVLAANTVFGLMIADTIEQFNQKLGCNLELLRFDFDQESTTDVYDQLRCVKDFKPDLIVNAGVVRTNYMIINQAAELGLRPGVPMMATFPFPLRSDDYWRLAGENGNLMVWVSTYYRPSWTGLRKIGRWFTNRYVEKYGNFPPDNTLNAFTDVTIIAQALELARDETRTDLIEALESGEFDTWRGAVRFLRENDQWHHSSPELVLMQYQQVGQNFDDAPIIYPAEARTHQYVAPA